MKTESTDAVPDRTLADCDTPAYRLQRITALKRELDSAMDMLAEIATVLTNANVPYVAGNTELNLTDRVRWLVHVYTKKVHDGDQGNRRAP